MVAIDAIVAIANHSMYVMSLDINACRHQHRRVANADNDV